MKIDGLIDQKIVAKLNELTGGISSMVFVKKPQSNKLDICIDPHALNQALQRPCYPQPTIEDILPQLSKVFLVLDAKDGFWQVKLDEESCYLMVPFGINTAPEKYQRGQTKHVSDFPGVAVIADDHLVFGCSNTMEETCKDHSNNLCGLLKRARKIELWFNSAKIDYSMKKCVIWAT